MPPETEITLPREQWIDIQTGDAAMEMILEALSLLVIGWIAGAETGSWCCVQPLIRHLPYEQQVAMEKAMLRTFGRIMPVLMPLSGVLTIALIILSRGSDSTVFWLRIAVGICIAVTVVTTLTINVPINRRTSEWQSGGDSSEWAQMRTRWHTFQGVRGGLFLMAFVLLAVSTVILH